MAEMDWFSETKHVRISAVGIPLLALSRRTFIGSNCWKRANRALNVAEIIAVVVFHALLRRVFRARDTSLLEGNGGSRQWGSDVVDDNGSYFGNTVVGAVKASGVSLNSHKI